MVIRITRHEMIILMCSGGKKIRLIDVLSREHFEQEHIRGAVSLPLNEIEKKAHHALNNNDINITYCAGLDCTASTEAAEKMEKMGFNNVYDYKGGLQDYRNADLPLGGSLHTDEKKVEAFPC